MIKFFEENSRINEIKGNGFRFKPHDGNSKYAYAITTRAGGRMDDNFIIMPEKTKKGYVEAHEGDGVYINRPHQKRGVVQKGMIQTIKTSGNDVGVVVNSSNKRLNETVKKIADQDTQIVDSYNQTLHKVVAPTITTRVNASNNIFLYNKLRIRKLTPKECWRLMGFNDEDHDKVERAGISNSQRYKQAGNSIVVNVLQAIVKQLL